MPPLSVLDLAFVTETMGLNEFKARFPKAKSTMDWQ